MATKPATKKTTNQRAERAAKKATKKVPAKKASPAKTSKKTSKPSDDEEDLEWMEAPKTKKTKAKKFPKLDLKPIKVPSKTVGKGKKAKTVKAKKLSASQVLNHVVEESGLARKDVKLVLDALTNTIKAAVMPGSVGGAVIPGIGALIRKHVPSRKIPAIARGTVIEKRNPRTGEVTKMKHPGRKAGVKPAFDKAKFVLLSGAKRAVAGTE